MMSTPATPRALEIRAATVADVDAVLDLWERSGTHRTVTDDVAGVTRLLDDAPGSLLMALDSGVVVGTIIAGWNGWRGGIYRIAVAPAHRRRGIARALIAAAVERLEALGARRIDALVVRDDDLARSFWDALSPEWTHDPMEKLRYVRIG
jgi:ribosomal protein S18 acetylase RimI-like enzyme